MHTHIQYGPAMVKEFYTENNVIFLTGATGFVGKTLLEKILRSLPNIKKIYLLIRVSGKMTLQGRIEKEIFTCRIFDTLKAQFATPEDFYNTIVKKVVPVKGDITVERLGLSDDDLTMIQRDTNIVLNSAASVSFDDPLNNALELNTKGPLRTIEIARGMPKLAAVVHISTCYVNSHLPGGSHLQEKVYAHPFTNDPEALFDRLQRMSYEEIRNFERDTVLKTYLNTYTFSKSLTEHLIQRRYSQWRLPIVIVRPSIVTAAIAEPVPGWVEGVAAANKAVVSCALGQVQEWIGDVQKKTDLIPVDMTVKLILLAATTASSSAPRASIYHAGTSGINPVTWGTFGAYLTAYWRSVARPRRRVSDDIRFEMYSPAEFKHRFDERFGDQIRHLAQIQDAKVKRRTQALISKAHAVPTMFRKFASNEWIFEAVEAMSLDDVAPVDFQCRLRAGIDWHRYLEDYNAGVQEFILREPVDHSVVVDYGLRPLTLELKPFPGISNDSNNNSNVRAMTERKEQQSLISRL
ncbi:cyclin-dependent kinase inhibitor far1 [Actinomortierella ambigua]|uniref:Fatty acyl-CoA reductase n=1 Tax=Actinomortierella ambigua TaxID=1343610 RepID=A0A9P6Q8U4_9FUNG|nr:cyclin-dependent kinase inhibitor far1 [Actinomortierella ambigua]